MSYVLVKEGSYRNQAVENTVFPLIKNFTPAKGKDGGFVTVDGSCRFGADATKVRISVDTPVHLQFVEQDAFAKQESAKADIVESVAPKYTQEDDEKRIQEIQERFEILDEMTSALTRSDIRAMIVTGPPGVGKSYGVEEQLSKS